MTSTFRRDRSTWLPYLLLAFFGYFVNVLGPITPFLKEELGLSYTVSSLHFTAFAIGILLVGVGGHILVGRVGRRRALWMGAFGLSVGVFLLLAGRSAALTIGASFCMGLLGSLILVIVPSALSDQHGEFRSVALTEANVVSSLVSTAAPLLVGWFAPLPGGWRLALGGMALAPFFMRLGFGHVDFAQSSAHPEGTPEARRPLPPLFWVYWTALALSVSVEFCMIFWSADYLETCLGMVKTSAAQAVSLFLGAMIAGRIAGSRLVRALSSRRVVVASALVAGAGFALFWTARTALLGMVGLTIAGLGVASLYPLLQSLAIGVASDDTVRAGARTTLASGTAILSLPLVLGRLADVAGIRPAYGVVAVLLLGILLIMLLTSGRGWGPRQ
ncbi:MAG TPA: MFS transporter [Anaerolineae bacterium]|nr:MFS transporter [Anaerolineae bacterium]